MWQVFFFLAVSCAEDNCSQTWFHLSSDGNCVCGANVRNAILCSNETREVRLQLQYCMTSNGNESNIGVVGNCMMSVNHDVQRVMSPDGSYYKVLSDRSAQDNKTCSHANRHGRLCSQCKTNHTISAYSYVLKCHQCTSALFLAVILLFRISITSPAMNVPVLCCQFRSFPLFMVNFVNRTMNTGLFTFTKFITTVYGIWNLDFFRALISPICLPLTTLQVIALDYLVAVYPLLLLIFFYCLVTAYARGFKPLVCLCKPFLSHNNAKTQVVYTSREQ